MLFLILILIYMFYKFKKIHFSQDIHIVDGNDKTIDIDKVEVREQKLSKKYIKENDKVLELGARFGSVSCTINKKLNNGENHVVVEPDENVWKVLDKNKKYNNATFKIVKGVISNHPLSLINRGYGSTTVKNDKSKIPHYTLNEIKQKYNIKFNVLVADCEGCLENFFEENPSFYKDLRMIIFEKDYPNNCNYKKIENNLKNNKFKCLESGHQNVWEKIFYFD